MSVSEAQKKAKKKYKANVKRYVIECYPTDSDIITALEKHKAENGKKEGYSTYIKKLIRKDIANK
jgi:hypothetical protein